MNPLDIILIGVLFYFANRWSKKNLGVSYWVVLKKFFTGRLDDLTNNAQKKEGLTSYQILFEKFCRVAHMDPLDAFKTASKHMGFGFTEGQIKAHFDQYLRSNCTQMPNYMESFLDQGKDYILNA